ncbi:N-acetyltransferase [Blastococcus sp. TF02A-26]|uniref:GNAT family N-acetyltransferase n=1 Tax=Blastococcus sp. TF02A-26 TaxID=2250577 RepID=UPI000DEB36D0|nr:GNAT family N-acetyltransferase [Blastococcus sp. TF02A-26]RBY81026.1 N-acetyltransferase [Blastococcus sp. TF02A-26]
MSDVPTVVRVGLPSVRPAEQRDVPRIAATLTVAHADSRWTRWALPEDGRIQRLTRWHELSAGHRGVSTGTAWVTEDVTAVATWTPPAGAPGTTPMPADVRAALDRELPVLSGAHAARVARTRELVDAARPAGPHWWLEHLGTRPSSRRQGLGRAVLGPALDRCDADGVPAATSVYTWAGVRFLRGSGFEVAASLHTADDELPVWVLVRPPAPGVESG